MITPRVFKHLPHIPDALPLIAHVEEQFGRGRENGDNAKHGGGALVGLGCEERAGVLWREREEAHFVTGWGERLSVVNCTEEPEGSES